MRDVKIAFFGTPDRAARTLEILKKHEIVPELIITAPDRPQGRGMKLTPPPVKVWAEQAGIAVLQPEKIDDDFREAIEKQEWDLFIVVAYGKILPLWLLELPRHKTLNVHYSLLPLYRGATPVETQILEGEEITGVTIMLIDEKVDHGPILEQVAIPMPDPLPTNPELTTILTELGGELLAAVVPEWISGNIEPQNQEHELVTFTRKFSKEEGEVSLTGDPVETFRKIQAFTPWPGTYFFHESNGEKIRVKINKARLNNDKLELLEVTPAGKTKMSYEEFKGRFA